MKIQNPVLRGFYPDPSLCCANGHYYMVTSSFEFYPGVPVFESLDLVNWKQIGCALTTPAQARLQGIAPSRGIWAPTIRYFDGVFYLCTTNMDGGGNFFVTARDPAGPWSEPVFVPMKSIDPSMFSEGGKLWFLTPQTKYEGATRGVYIAEISPQTGRLLTEETLLWQGSGGKCLEGPRIYHIGSWYYLLAAEGGTEYGHMVTLARAKSLLGPYQGCPHNPVITSRDDHDAPLQCTGHAELVQAPDGSWAFVLLGTRRSAKWYSHLGREVCLAPAAWQDGWPVLAGGGRVAPLQPDIPWLNTPQHCQVDFADAFSATPDWAVQYLRLPQPACYQRQNGALRLTGGAPLYELDGVTWYGRRQQEMDCTVQTRLRFEPQPGTEAGLTVYLNNRYHYDLGVSLLNGQPTAFLRQTLGGCLCVVTAMLPLPAGPWQLEVKAQAQRYHFGIAVPGQDTHWLGEAETKFLSNEVAKSFTGVFFALYCVDALGKATATFEQFSGTCT